MEPGEVSSCCAVSIAGENTFVKLLNLVYYTVKICTLYGAGGECSAWRSSLLSVREVRHPNPKRVLWKTLRRPEWDRWEAEDRGKRRRGTRMNFSSMDYFVMVARKRSFSRAAERLHITQ